MANKPQQSLNYSTRRTVLGETPMLKAHLLTYVAFALSLIIVIARLTTTDSLRDPWEIMPGSEVVPTAPGPATGLVFDLLACLPVVLILARRGIDNDFHLCLRWSHAPLFALAAWAVISTAWASDKFAAVITSSHFFAAACLLWSMSQLVKTSARFRFVASVCFGLLLVLVVQSAMYKFIDVPQNISYWEEHKTEILKARNWVEGSFTATQFAQKLTRGELAGFFNSANTFAAVGVLLFAASVGIGIQKLVDKDPPRWAILILVALLSLGWILLSAKSKTAAATPVLGVMAVGLFFVYRQRLRSKHRLAYFSSVGLVALAIVAVIGHGLYHHGLFQGYLRNSLDFRWKYWIASVGIFKAHPLIGVGWNNFGLSYLAHRLPEAAEEIKDPHSFLVRFFVELGLVGGVLCVLWLLRLAWEVTQPTDDSPAKTDAAPLTIQQIAPILVGGMFLSVLATDDFSLSIADMILIAARPILYLLVLVVASIAASLRTSTELDARPAPWIYYCTLTGLGLFLLHNLIDFSWFEPGPMFVFMALIGAIQGMASNPHRDMGLRPMPATLNLQGVSNSQSTITGRMPVSPRRGLALLTATMFGLIWLVIAVVFVFPVIAAEALAGNANESIRTASYKDPNEFRSHVQSALDDLKDAGQWVPYNSDYVYRQAMALTYVNQDVAARSLLDRVKKMNPLQADAYLLDANMQLRPGNSAPNQALVKEDFQAVLAMNPNDVSLHIQYARALDRFGLRAEAKQQYQLALTADAALPIGEPKRLSPEDVEKYRKAADAP
jgi:O-antigen ligase